MSQKFMLQEMSAKEQVLAALKPLETEWKAKEVNINHIHCLIILKNLRYILLISLVPRQSVIYIGYLALVKK